MLKNNTTIDGQIITAGELVVKEQYLCSVQDSTNWYWEQQPLQQAIIVPTRTILHSRLDSVGITDIQDIPKSVRNSIQARKSIQGHPICLIDADYDYILDGIDCQDKIEFERTVSDGVQPKTSPFYTRHLI